MRLLFYSIVPQCHAPSLGRLVVGGRAWFSGRQGQARGPRLHTPLLSPSHTRPAPPRPHEPSTTLWTALLLGMYAVTLDAGDEAD